MHDFAIYHESMMITPFFSGIVATKALRATSPRNVWRSSGMPGSHRWLARLTWDMGKMGKTHRENGEKWGKSWEKWWKMVISMGFVLMVHMIL